MKKVYMCFTLVYIHVCDVEQDHNQIFSHKEQDLMIFVVDSEQQFHDLDKKMTQVLMNNYNCYVKQSEFACQKQFYDSEELYEERRKEVLTSCQNDFENRFNKTEFVELDLKTFHIKQ